MSLRASPLLGLVLAALAACTSRPVTAPPPPGWEAYGAGIRGDAQPLALEAVLADPAAHDGAPVLLEGTVDEVCQVKGCWMTLSSGGRTVRVRFADYAFFVPKDVAGRTVRVEGRFAVREIPVDEARHYLEDAGRAAEAASVTAPQRGYEIVATGVLVQAS